MQNVIYKDDREYPELLRQIGKDAPKQLYYKTSVIPSVARNPLKMDTVKGFLLA
ncbi:MAG: hypothetical protein V1768_02735 [Patescibacteria group bacterium]